MGAPRGDHRVRVPLLGTLKDIQANALETDVFLLRGPVRGLLSVRGLKGTLFGS
jgi:hypothetical protein